MPKLDGTVSGSYTNFLGSLSSGVPGVGVSQTQKTAAAGVTLTLPIFQGGRTSAQAMTSQAIENYVATERHVNAQTRRAYVSWRVNERINDPTQQARDPTMLPHVVAAPEKRHGPPQLAR